jgi:excisionase family DNA binding protein
VMRVRLPVGVEPGHTSAQSASPPPASPAVLLLTIAEAAAQLRIGRSTAYELINSGQLEVVHIGRSARVPAEAVEQLVLRLRRRAVAAPTVDRGVS